MKSKKKNFNALKHRTYIFTRRWKPDTAVHTQQFDNLKIDKIT